MKKTATKTTKNLKDFYSFKNYSSNKNAVPVNYKGTKYLSKAQCMALEGITRKELDAYLNGQEETVVEPAEQTVKQVAIEETIVPEEEEPDITPDDLPNSLDDLLLNE